MIAWWMKIIHVNFVKWKFIYPIRLLFIAFSLYILLLWLFAELLFGALAPVNIDSSRKTLRYCFAMGEQSWYLTRCSIGDIDLIVFFVGKSYG